ncbi:MAG: glycosyltransferase family 4 protein [Methanobacteriaceae archaeon]|nr:glycosyltransferase family 4 protein [Methanobacteriaceae archaeon]
MKICYITNLYPPTVLGGAEIVVEKTALEMVKKGHKVIVITTSPDYEEHFIKHENIRIYQINTTKLYPVYRQTEVSGIKKPLWHIYDLWNNDTLNRIEKILQDTDTDIIHINNYKGLSLSCFKAGKDLGIPVVFESHDFSLICPRANLIRGNNTLCKKRNLICDIYVDKQRKLLSDNVDLLISPSHFMIEKFKENQFFNNTRCVKIPLGVEYTNHKSAKTYDIIDITYIGTLGKHKGVHTLINAFKEIPNSNIRLHIIGKGYDEEEFKQRAQNDKRIIFHGFVDNNSITEYYDSSNIVIIPSICYDNSPLVIYESFSTGTPVIGSDIGGIPELIIDNYNGLLFEPGNSEDLKDKILTIINNNVLLRRLEDNAASTLPENSMKIMTDRMIEEYKKLLRT